MKKIALAVLVSLFATSSMAGGVAGDLVTNEPVKKEKKVKVPPLWLTGAAAGLGIGGLAALGNKGTASSTTN